MDVLAIGLAGVAGAWLRYIVGWALNGRFAIEGLAPFPIGTFSANILGSFILAWFTAATLQSSRMSERMKLAVTTGFLGSFTTFSAWSVETLALLQENQWMVASAYIILSLVLGLAFSWAGYRCAGRVTRKQSQEEKTL
jgi:fluoride exporter